jgi:SAM-dependent methyltransferase
MPGSLERIDPDLLAKGEATGLQTLQLHLARYEYAARFLQPGRCADIACGIGYGSHLLATRYGDRIESIIAVDIDEASISAANNRYAHPKISFIAADATAFVSSIPFSTIISLETIEHLPNPAAFVKHLAGQLIPGGHYIASVPVTPSMDANPYHLHDFTPASFEKLFTDAGLKMIDSFIQVQPYKFFDVVSKKEERSKDLRSGMLGYYLSHPGKFFLRMRSLLTDGFTNKYMVAAFLKEPVVR